MRLGVVEYRTRRCRRCGPDADARLGSHFLGRGIQQPEWRTQTAKLPAPPGARPEEPTPPVKKAA